MKKLLHSVCFFAAAVGCASALMADVVRLTYSSGTGFIVGRDGYAITNNHVIEHCKDEITLAGAVNAPASLIARDTEFDLALLRTQAIVSDIANLSSEKQPLKEGDPVVIVGYPGESWRQGHPMMSQANILNLKGPRGEAKWMEFSDSLAQGNSGGPLLDQSGNVAGVVAAKGKLYERNETAARDELIEKFDIAISLPTLRKFLDDNGVRYNEADSGIYLSPDRIEDAAKRFVVNVKCKVED